MRSRKKTTTIKPNCLRCAKRASCTKICEKLENYLNSIIPSDFGKEYPIGSREYMLNVGLPKGSRTDVFKIESLSEKEQIAILLRLLNIPSRKIAKMLNIKTASLRDLVYNARLKIRHHSTKLDNNEELLSDADRAETTSRRRKVKASD